MAVPSELVPLCPVCGRPMTMKLRAADQFVEDAGWVTAAERYTQFLQTHGDRILFLELGVGYNTPVIIKDPFRRMTARNPDAVYACLSYGEEAAPEEIAGGSIRIRGDIGESLNRLGCTGGPAGRAGQEPCAMQLNRFYLYCIIRASSACPKAAETHGGLLCRRGF